MAATDREIGTMNILTTEQSRKLELFKAAFSQRIDEPVTDVTFLAANPYTDSKLIRVDLKTKYAKVWISASCIRGYNGGTIIDSKGKPAKYRPSMTTFVFDKQSNKRSDKLKVVINYFDVLGHWSISHAKSGQNAFRSTVNKFKSYEDALAFAERNNCVVVQE